MLSIGLYSSISLAWRTILEPLLRTTSKIEFMKMMKRSGPRIDH